MSELLMVVGSLNREAPYFQGARGVGLSVFGFDPETGAATRLCEAGGVDNPTFLSVDPRSRCVYANSEVFGWHEGTVSAFRYDPEARRLVYLNKQPSLGSITAHNSLTRDGRHLLVANYGMGPEEEGPDRGLAVFPVGADGRLGAVSGSVAHRGRGPDPARQERAHPHCVLPSPDGRFAVVADLGLDALMAYRLGPDGTLPPVPAATTALPPGSGPRHFAWVPGGRMAVLMCELGSTVASLGFDPGTGAFTQSASVPALPAGWSGENHGSDIQVTPDGRFAYAANRGHDSIAILALDPDGGALVPRGHEPSGGRTPRHLALTPDGRHLVAANQNGDGLAVFAIEPDGGLRPVAHVAVGSPMCVAFMPPA